MRQVLVILLLVTATGACTDGAIGDGDSAGTPLEPVVVHNFDVDDVNGDPWVGVIVEEGSEPDLEFTFLAEGTGPRDLESGVGMGVYERQTVQVFTELGGTQPVPSRSHLIRVVDGPSDDAASVEMVWLAWQGNDPAQYELQAAIEHDIEDGFHLHANCHVVETMEFAAALTDNELNPNAAWKIGLDYVYFEEVDPMSVDCEPMTG